MTDAKKQLLRAVQRYGDRRAASELAYERNTAHAVRRLKDEEESAAWSEVEREIDALIAKIPGGGQ